MSFLFAITELSFATSTAKKLLKYGAIIDILTPVYIFFHWFYGYHSILCGIILTIIIVILSFIVAPLTIHSLTKPRYEMKRLNHRKLKLQLIFGFGISSTLISLFTWIGFVAIKPFQLNNNYSGNINNYELLINYNKNDFEENYNNINIYNTLINIFSILISIVLIIYGFIVKYNVELLIVEIESIKKSRFNAIINNGEIDPIGNFVQRATNFKKSMLAYSIIISTLTIVTVILFYSLSNFIYRDLIFFIQLNAIPAFTIVTTNYARNLSRYDTVEKKNLRKLLRNLTNANSVSFYNSEDSEFYNDSSIRSGNNYKGGNNNNSNGNINNNNRFSYRKPHEFDLNKTTPTNKNLTISTSSKSINSLTPSNSRNNSPSSASAHSYTQDRRGSFEKMKTMVTNLSFSSKT